MIKEFCAENFTTIPQAIQHGARRIELCDNLTVGGTSVSLGVLTETISYCHELDIPVMTIIRPRGGDFFYNDTELKMMEIDILEAKKVGADGVVIGCLTEDQSEIDIEAMDQLLAHTEGLQVTFHMAFDALSKEEQFNAIDWLVERGVERILTHGGPAGTPIQDNFEHLQALIAHADGRIIILPGGGITAENAQEVIETLGVKEVHGTKIV
ncbi:copper homeostasis protein CutC [Vagococcus xieshaowenii]|uniref:PF03932 family protein CutC n=1 Tax=Vagococcus xieshaowenii TaxID=2562451 RepID=A0AAJ5JQB2_9ENTE|nr:copper homeostasis protein CutC [Vagococcus xieshaowenii]QCA29566.1 copper homeostasis protein CutC [Vagococcus xieshaowenii]TFZ40311.1 copper homeostasis protein CutC [Vagococcus xieshaowenii]